MKALFLFLFAILFIQINTNAQVYNGDIVLYTQDDVDAFNYSEVTGDLHINGAFDDYIYNIDGLSILVSVGGDLTIYSNGALANINGLSSLSYVGGLLEISQNDLLTNVDVLQGVNVQKIWINSNDALTNINGIDHLNNIDYLDISDNAALNSLSGLINLNTVGTLIIEGNPLIINLDYLLNLTSVADEEHEVFRISDNQSLTNINGLINIQSMGGYLYIENNPALTNIDGLSGLSSTNGGIFIESNMALTNIDPLSNLSSVAWLEINNNDALTYLPFDNLISVEYDLIIHDNDALPNLDGFAILSSVGRDLDISDNDALTNTFGSYPHNLTIGGSLSIRSNTSLVFIEGLSFLPSLGGDLEISGNSSLSNIQELENIGSIGGNVSISSNSSLPFISFSDLTTLGGNLRISDNASLTNVYVPALPSVSEDLVIQNNSILTDIDGTNLTTVGRFLNIGSNSSLTNFNGLSNLTSVGGLIIGGNAILNSIDPLLNLTTIADSVTVENNPALNNLNGLSNITSVGEDLNIVNNDALINLDDLSNLTSVGGNLYILNNNSLSELCGISLLLSGNGLTGSYNVSGNAANPSQEQIIAGLCSASANAFYMTMGEDDIMYYNGSTNRNVSRFGETNNIYRGIEQVYKNVTIPQDAVITSAVLEVKANATNSGVVVADVYTDLRDNPLTVMSYNEFNGNTNFSSVTNQYSAPDYTMGNFYQVDITNLIQDRVNKADWTEGDNLGLIIKGNTILSGNFFRDITRAENSLTDNKLIITYNTAIPLVYNGDLTLTSQAEVDAFNYNEVTGNLTIDDAAGDGAILDITNLNGLSELTSVGEYFQIFNNDALTNLDGLSNLTSVGVSFNIVGNPALTNVDGLSGLSSIVELTISINPSLVNINGLSNLTTVEVGLSIQQNDDLTNLDGLSNLSYIGNGLSIIGNDALTNVDGLSNLTFMTSPTSVNGALAFGNNPALTNLDGLSGLTSVGGSLIIFNNDSLVNLDGLSNLTSIGRDLSFTGNDGLPNINGLSNLSSVGGNLNIQDHTTLTEFCGLYTLLSNNGLGGTYNVSGNGGPEPDPTEQEIIDGGPCSTTNTFYMTMGADDIMYYNGSENGNVSRFGETNNVYRGIEQIYKNITIPPDAEITSAMLEVKANGTSTGTVVADIYSDLRDDPSAVMPYSQFNANTNFSPETFQYSAPAYTAGIFYQVDITSLIQDRVNQSNWTEGDNLGIIIKGDVNLSAGFYREITRAENSLTDNKLIVTYDLGLPKFASNETEVIPDKYELLQNYPNPFNPSTIISWQLPVSGQVSLKVYDILGNEIATLVDENKEAGFYETRFDGSSLASGMYIYRLTTGSYVSTKKMLMIK